jgi:hypothetical protein
MDAVEVARADGSVVAQRHRLVDAGLAAERRVVNRLGRGGIAVVVLGPGADVRGERFAVHPSLLIALAMPCGDGVEERERIAGVEEDFISGFSCIQWGEFRRGPKTQLYAQLTS